MSPYDKRTPYRSARGVRAGPHAQAGSVRLGKTMLFASFAAALGLLSLVFDSTLNSRNNPNQHVASRVDDAGIVEVELVQGRGGHYVATGKINAQHAVFLLDTGATHVSVPANVANAIGLKRGAPMQVSTANGTITTYSTKLDSVELGDIRIGNVRASINPHMEGDEVLLGMSFLRNLELVQRDRTLKLRQYSR